MSEHVQAFEERLIGLFERKAEEFGRYSQEDALTSSVTTQLAGLYRDLVEVMKH